MGQKEESRSWLKVAAMAVVAWLGLVALINLFIWMATEGSCDLVMLKQLLPVTGLLCIPVTGILVADYLRPLRRN